MSIYNKISENIVLKLSDILTNWNVKKSLDFLQKSQWWSINDIISYQEEKLFKLVNHAFNNVQYYNELFKKNKLVPDDIKTIDDLKKLPPLTKEKLVENFKNKKLIAKNISKKDFILSASSGSTGLTTRYYINKSAYGFNIACNLRGWYWMGYRLGDTVIKVSQNKRNNNLKKLQDFINRTLLYTNRYDEDSLKKFINYIPSTSSVYLRSYPDPLFFIASHINRKVINELRISAINTTGNILFPEIRKFIEKLFNTKIYDSYGCEGGVNLFECPTHNYYHCSSESGIIEIVNTKGEDVHVGEDGYLLITNLQNYAMPFIRYDSKDIVTKGGECSCGRALLTIKRIQGRDNDIIVTPDKQYLIAQNFTTFIKNYNSIEQFQIHQKSINELIFNLVVNKNFTKTDTSKIKNYWRKYTNHEMKIYINIVKNIPLLPSDKRRFIIREKEIKLNI